MRADPNLPCGQRLTCKSMGRGESYKVNLKLTLTVHETFVHHQRENLNRGSWLSNLISDEVGTLELQDAHIMP